MKRSILPVITILLFFSCNLLAQEMVLDPKSNRFLINQKTQKPRLDVIVQSFTDYEKKVISKLAVMDTVTKPKFERVSDTEYNVTASRMGEKLTFVVRDFEQLPKEFNVSINPAIEKGDSLVLRPDQRLVYNLNGEKSMATADIPFGQSKVTLRLMDAGNAIIFKLNVHFSYPSPVLLYVDLTSDYGSSTLEDTTNMRRIVHRVNNVPTVYSHNNAVPDRVVTNYSNLFFGFKKAYYDGKIGPSVIISRIDNRPFGRTLMELYPFTDVQTLAQEDDWYILPSGRHTIRAGYVFGGEELDVYTFEMNKNKFNILLHYATQTVFFIFMILFSKPWILLILLGLVLFANWGNRMKRQREAAQKTNLELQTIQSQLNPHFVFNALGSVQGLINKNEIEKADTYLTDFSKLLRNSLNNSGKDMVPLSVELHALDSYIRLEQLRFNFRYQLHVDDRIDTNSVEIPSFLIQPVIENAIKHGISALGERGLLTLNFVRMEQDLIVEVIDNGEGFNCENVSEGKGLGLTRERIKLLSKQKNKIFMEIMNPESGTTLVRFVLKHSFS
jgi:hypothetical protein